MMETADKNTSREISAKPGEINPENNSSADTASQNDSNDGYGFYPDTSF